MPELALLIVVIAAAIGFGVVNGFNDAANSVAASIGSRAISPRNGIVLAAFCDFAGAATGLAVARTIGKGILDPEIVKSLPVVTAFLIVISALVAVIIWGAVATRLGLPVSITHGFVTGLAAAGASVVGWHVVIWHVLERIGISVVAAPTLGFISGFALMVVLLWVFRRSAPAKMRVVFSRLQWLTTAFLAYSHGKNDGQMPIGVITMALVIYTGRVELWDSIPWWVIVISALAISFGTLVGGWRVIRTVGIKITALQPVHGFAVQASAATVIEIASRLGIPVSTTHCATAATMGVGATKRLSAVRWGVTRRIVLAWVLTFPICGALGWIMASLLKLVL
ncbi:MAG: inorganic phosphate transporter [Chloroflexi bacterium RBG_13_51_36]|nr:MAG: inorganic phosphate transporter [Chloroflexi bacterium RBG_13_51_36]